jgi:hypothetical protein
MSGVSIVCFASSYAIALVLEITRLLFRSGVRGAIMVGFTLAGLVAHSAFLFYQAAKFYQSPGEGGIPLSSPQDWYLMAAWLLAIVYLYLTCYYPGTSFGAFILPLVLALIGAGRYLADSRPFPREPASLVWGIVHGVSILLATVAVLIGFAAGLMYLHQARRLKQKAPPKKGFRLPSLEWLRRANSRTIVIALVMSAVGIVSGMILNLSRAGGEAGLPWSDPVVLVTSAMFLWLLAASVAGWFYKPAREGRKVAYLTVVSFVVLVIVLAVGLSVDTRHLGMRPRGGTDRPGQDAAPAARPEGAPA